MHIYICHISRACAQPNETSPRPYPVEIYQKAATRLHTGVVTLERRPFACGFSPDHRTQTVIYARGREAHRTKKRYYDYAHR